MVIEISTFRLKSEVVETAFLEADHRLQTEFISNHSGFVRRTTARGEKEIWLVVTLWESAPDADASARLAENDPVAQAFSSLIDPETLEVTRFVSLD